jgi:hypothetical protein
MKNETPLGLSSDIGINNIIILSFIVKYKPRMCPLAPMKKKKENYGMGVE